MNVLYIRDKKTGKLIPIYTIQGEPGTDGKDGKDGEDYVLTEEDLVEIVNTVKEQMGGDVLNRIDPAKVPNGDPTNPATDYDVGTYAAVYLEYYGSDKKWRPRLFRASAASYSSLSEAAVEKFKENLLGARLIMTDSAGRLSIAAPQKGKNGLYYYYNPEQSANTNNIYNKAVPLWYADERYVKQKDFNSTVGDIEDALDAIIEIQESILGGG